MNISNKQTIQLLEEIRDIQNEFAIYGVEFEDSKDNNKLSFDMRLKFSLPEFYEIEHAGVNTDNLKILVKNKMKEILFKTWRLTTPNITDDELEECWKIITVMCRIRKGEIWTQEKVTEAIERTNNSIDKVIKLAENPYEEV